MVYVIWLVFAIFVGMLGNNRKIGFAWAFFWSILLSPLVGLIIVLVSDNKSMKSRPKYKDHLENGEKAEFKGQLKEAVDHYMDSLFHLEHDYDERRLSKQLKERRQKHIAELTDKIDNIKSNNPDLFSNSASS